jgi:hypothetical protein
MWAGVGLVAGALASAAVDALGLDEITQQSTLGAPLRIVIPVITGAGSDVADADLAGECFRLVGSDARQPSDLPQILYGRLALERSVSGVYLVVSTTQPITDPALSVTVQAGCTVSIRRQYTLLLDPPAIEVPMAESAAPTRTGLPALSATDTAGPPDSAPSAKAAPKRITSTMKAFRGMQTRVRPPRRETGPTVAHVKPPAAESLPAAPHLRVSRGIDEPELRRGVSEAITSGAGEPPSTAAVEVETIVLQRRVAELSEMVQRMQQDLRAAQAARDAAEAAAKATPLAKLERRVGDDWPLFVALIVLAALLIAVWSYRRRVPAWALGKVTPIETDSFAPTLMPEPPAVDTTRGGSTAPPPATDPATEARAATPVASQAGPPSSEFGNDLDLGFEEDLVRNAEHQAAFSAIEREYPRLVAKLIRTWGRPDVVANLRDVLISPRVGAKPLSRDAVSELMLLQSIAIEFPGPAPDRAWQLDTNDSKP